LTLALANRFTGFVFAEPFFDLADLTDRLAQRTGLRVLGRAFPTNPPSQLFEMLIQGSTGRIERVRIDIRRLPTSALAGVRIRWGLTRYKGTGGVECIRLVAGLAELLEQAVESFVGNSWPLSGLG
jgi:hypothetical protein